MFIEKTKSVVDGSDVNNRRFFNKKKVRSRLFWTRLKILSGSVCKIESEMG